MRNIEEHAKDYENQLEGNPLRIARTKAGLTQAAVAGMLGVSIPIIHWWEKGASRPNAKNMRLLASFLDLDPAELEARWGEWLEGLQ